MTRDTRVVKHVENNLSRSHDGASVFESLLTNFGET